MVTPSNHHLGGGEGEGEEGIDVRYQRYCSIGLVLWTRIERLPRSSVLQPSGASRARRVRAFPAPFSIPREEESARGELCAYVERPRRCPSTAGHSHHLGRSRRVSRVSASRFISGNSAVETTSKLVETTNHDSRARLANSALTAGWTGLGHWWWITWIYCGD